MLADGQQSDVSCTVELESTDLGDFLRGLFFLAPKISATGESTVYWQHQTTRRRESRSRQISMSRAERKCTGGAEQNCTTERRRICVEIRGA